ncbi:MAG: DUF1178 family protein [Alphaproteobacteria bacterium]|nr:DUF1178 family protein [Alphaproteobacteria bacterium]
MIRLQLKCVHGDYFDAWFPDQESFDAQAAKAQVVCPHCGETDLAEAPPLKPGLYPDLTEDQARQMSCDTRRMLGEWMAAGGMESVSSTLVEQAAQIMPAPPERSPRAPEPVEPAEFDDADPPAIEARPPAAKPAPRAIVYDC